MTRAADFKPPASFTKVAGETDFTVSASEFAEKTREEIFAAAFPTTKTQADLDRALKSAHSAFQDFGAQLGTATKVCGRNAIRVSVEGTMGSRAFKADRWTFVSNGTGYALVYIRPRSLKLGSDVIPVLEGFCPGQERAMTTLGLPKRFTFSGVPKEYHLHAEYLAKNLGGDEQTLTYLSGIGLEYDPALSAAGMKASGWKMLSERRVPRCGQVLTQQRFSYGSGEEAETLERIVGQIGRVVHILSYWRPSSLPASPDATASLQSFCISRPHLNLTGKWGGADIKMDVGDSSASIVLHDCSIGTIMTTNPYFESEDGKTFSLPGTLLSATGSERDVRYRGSLVGPLMNLHVIALDGRQLNAYVLKKGVRASGVYCPGRVGAW